MYISVIKLFNWKRKRNWKFYILLSLKLGQFVCAVCVCGLCYRTNYEHIRIPYAWTWKLCQSQTAHQQFIRRIFRTLNKFRRNTCGSECYKETGKQYYPNKESMGRKLVGGMVWYDNEWLSTKCLILYLRKLFRGTMILKHYNGLALYFWTLAIGLCRW